MKIQVNRAFKSCSFSSLKKQKNKQVLHQIFFNPQNTYAEVSQSPILKSGFRFQLTCSDYWKMRFPVKKMNLDIFTHAPPMAKLSEGSYHNPPPPPGRGELLIPTVSCISLVPPPRQTHPQEFPFPP